MNNSLEHKIERLEIEKEILQRMFPTIRTLERLEQIEKVLEFYVKPSKPFTRLLARLEKLDKCYQERNLK